MKPLIPLLCPISLHWKFFLCMLRGTPEKEHLHMYNNVHVDDLIVQESLHEHVAMGV